MHQPTDEQLRWLHETSKAIGDVPTARACIAALTTSEIVASQWTKETARLHCAAVWAGLVRGAQECREMMARFVEHGGDQITATSIRANWNPSWGADPGPPAPPAADAVHRCDGGERLVSGRPGSAT